MPDEDKVLNEKYDELMLMRKQLEEEIANNGESVLALVQLADVHMRLGERIEAIKCLQAALRLKPGTPSLISRLEQICTEEEFANLKLPEEEEKKGLIANILTKVFRADYEFRRDYTSFIRAGVVIIFAIYFFWCLRDFGWHFLDNADLVIHEVGHPVFGVFGKFIGMAGGTIMQLIVPLGITIYFVITRRLFSAAFVMFWLGQSFLNVSVYAADAVKMKLRLVGGNIHDWHYMFSRLNLLPKTDQIAGGIRNTGIIIMAIATVIGLITSFYQKSDLTQE